MTPNSSPTLTCETAAQKWRYRLWVPVLTALMLLSGCAKQLLGSLDETAANQVVSALRYDGIAADKAPSGEKFWKVTVPDEQLAEAVQILERRNLPSHQFQGLGQVFKKESLVSTPTEERARLIHAMSQELERSLMEIDGVLVARVHPVILPHDALNPKRSTASASVLIKYRAGIDITGRESMVRSLVAAGIEGLSYDDVRVAMVPAEAPSAVPGKASANPGASGSTTRQLTQRFPSALYGGVIAVLIAILLLSYAWVRWRRQPGDGNEKLRGRWAHTVNGFIDKHRPEDAKKRIKRAESTP
jgi:type III secretion protein J